MKQYYTIVFKVLFIFSGVNWIDTNNNFEFQWGKERDFQFVFCSFQPFSWAEWREASTHSNLFFGHFSVRDLLQDMNHPFGPAASVCWQQIGQSEPHFLMLRWATAEVTVERECSKSLQSLSFYFCVAVWQRFRMSFNFYVCSFSLDFKWSKLVQIDKIKKQNRLHHWLTQTCSSNISAATAHFNRTDQHCGIWN